MHPKIGYEVGDIVLTSLFSTLILILISRLSLSYPLEILEEGTQSQFTNTLKPQPDLEIAGITKGNESDNSILSKRTTTVEHSKWCKMVAGIGEGCNETKTHAYTCEFAGNVGLKNDCVRYLICTKVGTVGIPGQCTSGQHFDFIKRVCINEKDANCDSSKICPDNLTVYKVGNDYLQCRDGVPYPKKYPPCPANMDLDQNINRCVGKEANRQGSGQFGNNDLQQVVQVNAYQKPDGKLQVQVNKNVIQNGRTQSFNSAGKQQKMNPGPYSNQNPNPYFDLIMRMCIDKKGDNCESVKVCPDDLTVYKVGKDYLQCRNGIPYPNKYPSCPANMTFDQKVIKCVAKQGGNMPTVSPGRPLGDNDLSNTQVVQINAYVENGKGTQFSNSPGDQQQISGGYSTNQNLGAVFNPSMEQNQNFQPLATIQVGLSPNQNGITVTNQNLDTQNVGSFAIQNTGSFSNQDADTFPNQNGGTTKKKGRHYIRH